MEHVDHAWNADNVDHARSTDDVDNAASELDALEAEVADIQRALARLDDGTYGTCEACGAALPDAQLADSPAARWCPAHLPLAPAASD